MAVYTEVPDEDLARFVAPYGIGEVLSYKGIAEGVENTNFLLYTTSGRFILTLYEKRVKLDDLPFFLGLMEHLAARGITCPLPVKTTDGVALGTLCDRPAAIVTFLDGMWTRRPQVIHCAGLGRALAEFHAGAQDFPLKRANALSVSGWRNRRGPASIPSWPVSARRFTPSLRCWRPRGRAVCRRA
jgi:homoserine kinase type II